MFQGAFEGDLAFDSSQLGVWQCLFFLTVFAGPVVGQEFDSAVLIFVGQNLMMNNNNRFCARACVCVCDDDSWF